MKTHSKLWTAAAVAALVAAAFFLPERLLAWGDSQLLDRLQMVSQEEREGFAGSIRLTVPEKIMLLQGGALTVMELDRMAIERAAVRNREDGSVVLYPAPGGEEDMPEEDAEEARAASRMWEERLTSVRGELRSLQALGGLPEIWRTDDPPDCTGYGDLLYLDPDTYMSFQVYQLALRWEKWNLDLLVDLQSGRILSFSLRWTQGGQPNWGPRGASSFGSAWRDYWKMDSVSTGWYNAYTRGILENVEAQSYNSGDYAAHGQITFLYGSQSLSVPLDCQGSRTGNFLLVWNR